MINSGCITRTALGKLLCILGVLSTVLSLGGCGGGTTGTGGTGSVIEGRLLDTGGAPVSAALLTIEETGDSGTTDQTGEFSIETENTAPTVTLLVESGTTKAETVVDDIPRGDQKVDLDLELNPEQKTVKVKGKRVTARPTRTPSPVIPTQAPTAAPPQLPTAAPTPIPEVPTPTSVPDTEPTNLPTAVPTEAMPTPTAAPQRPAKTKFSGIIQVSDPALLVGLEINIPGKGRRTVEPDGTFKFFVDAGNTNSIIAIHTADKVARLVLDGISERSREVTLLLDLKQRPNGGLKLSLISVEIIERSEGDTAGGTVGEETEPFFPEAN